MNSRPDFLVGVPDRPQWRTACPQCDKGPRDSALSVSQSVDGRVLWRCHRCGYAGAWSESSPIRLRHATTTPKRIEHPATHETLSPKWLAFWRACLPLHGTLAEKYLHARQCVVPPVDGDLRFHPRAWHWVAKSQHPAMVASVTDARDASVIRTLHLTYLAPDGSGKAGVQPAKMLLPNHRKAGGMIRLFHDDHVTHGLAVAEGIESALSAAHLFAPMWATVDASNMTSLPLLAGIEALTVFADHDDTGRKAAHALADRWREAGREVRIRLPIAPRADVNDVARAAA